MKRNSAAEEQCPIDKKSKGPEKKELPRSERYRLREERKEEERRLQASAAKHSTPNNTCSIASDTSLSEKFRREPRGSSRSEQERLAELLAKGDAKAIPCSVPTCRHPGFALSAHRMNQSLFKKYEDDKKKNPHAAKPDIFDVPRLEDGSVAWDEPRRWTKVHSGTNYSNYFRGVVTHYAFMISVRKCKEHKEKCPKALVTRAQTALNKSKDPAKSKHTFRKLWEALELEKEEVTPTSRSSSDNKN